MVYGVNVSRETFLCVIANLLHLDESLASHHQQKQLEHKHPPEPGLHTTWIGEKTPGQSPETPCAPIL